MKRTYEIFTGDELVIAEKIQQRRYQMLVHSCLYYKLSQSTISDIQWDEWARELRDLQNQYPEISKQITLYEYFKDWDGSTGEYLPIDLDWVVNIATRLLGGRYKAPKQKAVDLLQDVNRSTVSKINTPHKKMEVKSKRRLF